MNIQVALLATLLLLACQAHAFVPSRTRTAAAGGRTNKGSSFVASRSATTSSTTRASFSSSSSMLSMALTPIGPFCPFRSSAAIEVEPRMEQLNAQTAAPEMASEMARIQLDIQMGKSPDSDQLFRVADGIDAAVVNWELLLQSLQNGGDFQTCEYAKLTTVHLAQSGVTPKGIASMMTWQGGCLRALALNAPPPMPPKDLDLQRMMTNANDANSGGRPPKTPSMTAMSSAEKITCDPFDESALTTDTIRQEYDQLCKDHNGLIELGSLYSTFDPMGKLSYLDEIEQVEERWDVFFARFELMGALNPKFVKQCTAFLESMNLEEQEYRELLRQAHDSMRKDAEEERDHFSY